MLSRDICGLWSYQTEIPKWANILGAVQEKHPPFTVVQATPKFCQAMPKIPGVWALFHGLVFLWGNEGAAEKLVTFKICGLCTYMQTECRWGECRSYWQTEAPLPSLSTCQDGLLCFLVLSIPFWQATPPLLSQALFFRATFFLQHSLPGSKDFSVMLVINTFCHTNVSIPGEALACKGSLACILQWPGTFSSIFQILTRS